MEKEKQQRRPRGESKMRQTGKYLLVSEVRLQVREPEDSPFGGI